MRRSLIGALLALLIPSFAAAQEPPPCIGVPGMAAAMLKQTFNESPMIVLQSPAMPGSGAVGSGAAFTVFVNPETQTWSLFLTTPQGDCLIAGGTGFTLDSDMLLGAPA